MTTFKFAKSTRKVLGLGALALLLGTSPLLADDDNEDKSGRGGWNQRDGTGNWNQNNAAGGTQNAGPGVGQADCRWTFSCGNQGGGNWGRGGQNEKDDEKDDD